jgi:type I restriction enzyme, S subunit
MEVREPSARYMRAKQQTEVGELPADWSCSSLGDVADILTGFPFPSAGYSGTGVRLLRGSNVKRDQIEWREDLTMYWPEVTGDIRRYVLKVGDIVIAMDGSLVGRSFGALSGHDVPALLLQRVARVRSSEVDVGYLKHWICSERFTAHCDAVKTTTAIPHISPGDIRSFKVAVPPTNAEQRQIGRALSDADSLIDSLEQLLTKKRQIKQGAMQELLTGKRRLPDFEAAWSDGVLGDVVAELVAGVSVNSDPAGGGDGVPSVVKTSALKGGVFDSSECKPIVQADLGRAATPLRQDTLLISRMNTPDLVGEVGYVDRAYDWLYLPDRIWMTRLRSPDCVCVRWLGYLLSSTPYKRLIGDTATGTSGSMKNIAKSALLGLPLRFPEVDEQRAIAAGLADMDAEITALESRLNKAHALKQAMAQALLTGRIRLVEPTA